MLWLLVGSVVMAGLQFSNQLGTLEIYTPDQIQFLISGTLLGRGLGFIIRKIEAF